MNPSKKKILVRIYLNNIETILEQNIIKNIIAYKEIHG